MHHPIFSIALKEFIEITRDKISVFMLVAIPVINLFIMGYSINMDPRRVSTALVDYDKSSFGRTLSAGMVNTGYFSLHPVDKENDAEKMFMQGKVQFLVIIPTNFSRDLLAEKKPDLFIQVDATDPASTANAIQALQTLLNTVFENDIKNINGFSKYNISMINPIIHKLYNPESISRFNIVPGLIGVILSIILTLTTCLSIIRERENGTMIHIINSATASVDIILGKITPYFFIGLLQGLLIIGLAVGIMDVPLLGSLVSLLVLISIFILLCLATGVLFSVITSSQLQAMQLSSFYFLLSNMLSGFISPFHGMPEWSQTLGSFLPLTYFLRLARGVMLKGYSLSAMSNDFTALLLMTCVLCIGSYWLFDQAIKNNLRVGGH